MKIEHAGFYETRSGRLAYVLARLPDGTNTEYQWAICYPDGEVDCHTDEGLYYLNGRKYPHDLIRYLPTVKSWDDPIPPKLGLQIKRLWGSDKYVNRIPADDGEKSGFLCADCKCEPCDRCGTPTFEPYIIEDLMDAEHVCDACLTPEEVEELANE